jgi:cysteinyl-tRNA synthetase
MDDDFNTPKAIAQLQELTREVNTLLNSGSPVGKAALEAIIATYNELGGDVLGIIPAAEAGGGANAEREAGLIKLIVEARQAARKAKNWAESDRLRDALAALDVIVEDRADGTVWRVN